MKEYSVALVVYGDFQSQEDVSNVVGIQPTLFHKKGERKSEKRVWEKSVWAFEVSMSPTRRGWESLENGLNSLLEIIGPKRESIAKLGERYEVAFRCGMFNEGSQANVIFPAGLLHVLGSWGIRLDLEMYSNSHENDEKERK